jgi:hypothetical protein
MFAIGVEDLVGPWLEKCHALLEKKLLLLGGQSVERLQRVEMIPGLVEYDEDTEQLLREGKIMTASPMVYPSTPNECHVYSTRLFLQSGGQVRLCTGYALAVKTNEWIRHSWCLTAPRNGKRRIIETISSVRWSSYYGITCDTTVAVERAFAELGPREVGRLCKQYPEAVNLVKRMVRRLRTLRE